MKNAVERTFEIVKHIGVIAQGTQGWQTELNLVAWNGYAPKYDIRDWNPTHDKMSKGLTLKSDQLIALKALLNTLDTIEPTEFVPKAEPEKPAPKKAEPEKPAPKKAEPAKSERTVEEQRSDAADEHVSEMGGVILGKINSEEYMVVTYKDSDGGIGIFKVVGTDEITA